ncbi:hypothetical protein [Sphingomonas sp. CROZ-RG-20F-R02-07]|uniref:hypothetical protein n=1 Tax=Sphingomonas sp. CROZ-RG-20F-R02-07 TaxID=2914832 RepID=UPI001F5A702E|nr:hypothetical protein [Sphingomonas sp. CROZ-RG-20F-R02-07]
MSSRANLVPIAEKRGHSLTHLSRLLGRNAAYLQQHVARGAPKRLDPDDRRRLAIYLEVDERELGARDPWVPNAPHP